MNTRIHSILMSLLAVVFVSCSEQAFNSAANAGKKEASKKPNGKSGEQNPGSSIDSPESVDSQEGTGKLEECSAEYAIPGTQYQVQPTSILQAHQKLRLFNITSGKVIIPIALHLRHLLKSRRRMPHA
jgi:hypothetical protein